MDFCLVLSAPRPPLLLLDFWTFTGEPLMLTKTLVFPTDLFTGGFSPVEAGGLIEVRLLDIPLVWSENLEFLAGEAGVKSFFGEEPGLDKGTGVV